MKCTRCGERAPEEFCWYCAERVLCIPCWEAHGECGHPEAAELNAYGRRLDEVVR